jgi:hypothetical protein
MTGVAGDPSGQPDDGDLDRRLEEALLGLLAGRRPGGSICPSEVARLVGASGEWRGLMASVRRVAWRLQRQGRVEITRKGRPVAADSAVGPIRIRLTRPRCG